MGNRKQKTENRKCKIGEIDQFSVSGFRFPVFHFLIVATLVLRLSSLAAQDDRPCVGDCAIDGQVTVELAIHDTGWNGLFDETDDYSFDAAHSTFAAWDKVTLYDGSTLLSGIEPP